MCTNLTNFKQLTTTFAVLLVAIAVTRVKAQAILYDNVNHTYHGPNGAEQMTWIGPQNARTLFNAMPFAMDRHDNIATVAIPLARNIDSNTTGHFNISIWDANDEGFPGQEVGRVAEVDVDSLPRFDFPNDLPESLPASTFHTSLGDLVPGDTYFLMMDYRGLDSIAFGDVIHGLSKSPIGSDRPGEWLISLTADEPPFGSNEWKSIRDFQGDFVYFQMAIEAEGSPFTSIPCAVGEVYSQDFNLFGSDVATGTALPPGWAFSDDPIYDGNGTELTEGLVYREFITDPFPAPTRLEAGTTLFNAGQPGSSDRALAIGTPRSAGAATIQLVADVVGENAESIQLAFDIEAWDAGRSRDNPGEAAFNVILDLNTGEGFEPILDLGTITTAARLEPGSGDFVNGNQEAYRMSFDSGPRNLNLPEGSQLRVRWEADKLAETRGWVFGLDNVSLGMFANILGDFDGDGNLTNNDIDLLSSAVRTSPSDAAFDLNDDGLVNEVDRNLWVTSTGIANGFFGDADLNGDVSFPDFLALSAGFGTSGGWAEGDFDGNGEVDFPDFLVLSENFGRVRAEVAAVPEPECFALATLAALSLFCNVVRSRRC